MSVREIVENRTKGVTGKTVQLLRTLGVTRWTQMQEDAMDKLYLEEKENSKDGLICASTGSGKTYAFLMPVLMRFLLKSDDEDKEDKTKVKAIAVLPTRELAQQVFEKAKGLFEEANGINVCLCVGGVRSHEKDAEDIIKRKPKLVVGTPGRMLELKKLNVLDLSKIEVQILDEIDRLLDGGFENDVLDVLRPPGSCQTICATATARGNLRRFLNKTLAFGYKEIGGKVTTTDENGLEVHNSSSEIGGNVAHCAYAISKSNSDNETAQIYAQAILTAFKGLVTASSSSSSNLEKSQCLCFVETKSLCDKIEVALQKESMAGTTNQKIQVRSLHSSLPQNQRDLTLLEARNRSIDIIVATDVASRGIDLPGVELVIHCGFPKDSESYVHRSGRAGRPGCNTRGCALILHSPEDGGKVSAFIEAETNVRVKRLTDVREACAFIVEDNREKSDASIKEERIEKEKKERLGENILIAQRFQMLDEELDGLQSSMKGGTKTKRKGGKR